MIFENEHFSVKATQTDHVLQIWTIEVSSLGEARQEVSIAEALIDIGLLRKVEIKESEESVTGMSSKLSFRFLDQSMDSVLRKLSILMDKLLYNNFAC